jgi:adenine-specific DNA methylase
VDAVVTDPPFFDNVHYSQLADFFYVWQRHILGGDGPREAESTRSAAEVQHSDAATFTERLCGVWRECHRVLRRDGLLVFTYHHSRAEGWRSILEATMRAGFAMVAAHPIKAEMSVAAPKSQAKEPIDLDTILACRKRESVVMRPEEPGLLLDAARAEAAVQIARFNAQGRLLSRNDVRVVLAAQLIRRLSLLPSVEDALRHLRAFEPVIEESIGGLHGGQAPSDRGRHGTPEGRDGVQPMV